MFRKFALKPPYRSIKDIFCLRLERKIDAYRRISINTLKLKVNGTPRDEVEVKIYPLNNSISQVRIWYKGELIDIHRVKNGEFKGVHFYIFANRTRIALYLQFRHKNIQMK